MKHLLACFLVIISLFGGGVALAEDFDASAAHAIAVDLNSGKILYEKDADSSAGIASLTKILTVYMVYKEIDAKRLSWNTNVKISDYAYDLTANSEASNVPMEKRQYTVRQLVDAAMIASANSAAIALAEQVAGTESAFVDKMSEQLKSWGITDAHLVNASGLNNSMLGSNIYPNSSADDENKMSAKDMAIIAYHLVTEYPEILKVTNQTTAAFDDVTMTTYNYMLPDMPAYRNGVNGLKTGTTELAGQSFVATSTESGMRLLTVVLHADNTDTNTYARFTATAGILDYITNNFEPQTVLTKGEAYKDSKSPIQDGKSKTVTAVAQKSLKVAQQKSLKKDNKVSIKYSDASAPIKKGQTLGTATYVDNNRVGSGYLVENPTVKMIAKEEVKRSFFLKVWWNHFVNYVNTAL